MDHYAEAVQEQQQRDRAKAAAAAAGSAGGGAAGEGQEAGPWQQIVRLDPLAQKLRRSKLARMAFRR